MTTAWQVRELGRPTTALTRGEVSRPAPGEHEVRVRVRATALNFPDVLLCAGQYQLRPELPFTPGVELCGDVLELGSAVEGLAVGDRVMGTASLPYGGFADEAIMAVGPTFVAPQALSDAEAAAFTIAYQTGWFALHRRAALREGETILIHAAAGGVGSAAIQLAKAAGARVIAVAGGADKAAYATQLGADIVVDRKTEDFVQVVKEATGGRGADVVFDPVGGDTYERSTKCIAFEGRLLVIGFAGGTIQAPPLGHALVKNYSIVGVHWGLYNTVAPRLVRQCHDELMALVDSGAIKPFVSETVPMADVPDALERLGRGATVGRLVAVPDAG